MTQHLYWISCDEYGVAWAEQCNDVTGMKFIVTSIPHSEEWGAMITVFDLVGEDGYEVRSKKFPDRDSAVRECEILADALLRGENLSESAS